MWTRCWGLANDPFYGPGRPFVATSSHAEALARLVDTIETAGRVAILTGANGSGKSTVLARAVMETKRPGRRFARVVGPVDGLEMLSGLAEGLGMRVSRGASRSDAWGTLVGAIKLCDWQHLHVVLIVDDAQNLDDAAARRDLERLTHLAPRPSTRLTVIRASFETLGDADWSLAIRLAPMLRSETGRYLAELLAWAGRSHDAFSPRAVDRIHERSGGNPRGVDRLASLAMRAGAMGGLSLVTADVVEGVAAECAGGWPGFSAA